MFRVFIDQGHHFGDCGADYPPFTESKLTELLGRVIKERLDRNPNLCVHTTLTSNLPNGYKKTRAEAANRFKADLFVSLHFNSSPNRRATGGLVLIHSKKRVPLGSTFLRYLPIKTRWSNVVIRRNLAVLKLTSMPAVLVECCFLSNASDREYILTHGVTEFAIAISNAIEEVAAG